MFNWQKFWLILIGIGCIGTFFRLTVEKNFVSFYSRFTESKDYPSFSMCIPLNITTHDYPLVDHCKSVEKQLNPYVRLICFVSKLKQLIPAEIIKYAKTLNVHEMFDITVSNHALKQSSIYMNDFHLCISYEVFCLKNVSHKVEEDYEDLELNAKHLSYNRQFDEIKYDEVEFLRSGTWTPRISLTMSIVNKFKVTSKLFIYPTSEIGYYFSLYKFNQFCSAKPFNESVCNSGQLIVSRTNYTRLPEPYVTDCFDYTKTNFNFTKNRIFSRVSCLEECRKSIFRSNRSYYSEIDDKELGKRSGIKYNQTFCLSKCKRPDCSQNFYYVNSWKSLSLSAETGLIKVIFLSFQYDIIAYVKTSFSSYILQMASYLCLVLNNNLIVQILKLHKELVCKLLAFDLTKSLGKLFDTEFVYVRLHFIAFLLALLISFKMFSNYMNEMDNKINGYISFIHYPTNYTHIIITICFPIIEILRKPEEIESRFGYSNQTDLKDSVIKLNNDILNTFTFNELISMTKNETELIKAEIIFNNLRKTEINTKILTSLLPTSRLIVLPDHILNLTLYAKCFSYNVAFNEFTFQRIFRMTSVRFLMLNEYFSHFTITENNRFPNFRDHKLFASCNLHRMVKKIENFTTDCRNYDTYYQNLKCTNRYECIDNCIKWEYAGQFKKIPFTSIYREGELIKDKNGNSVLRTETFTSQHNLIYREIKEMCEKKFRAEECERGDYVNVQSCSEEDFYFRIILIKLYLSSLVELKKDKYSFWEIFNQVTTLLSVLFGFSVPSIFKYLIKSVILVFKTNINSKRLKRKIRAFLFIVMCYNFNQILTRASENNPVPNTLYSAFDTFRLPRVTTCATYDFNKIYDNYNRLNKNLTGYDLDKETENIQIEKIYKRISFYSLSLEKIDLEFKDLVKNQSFKSFNISFNRFYFHDFKCFNIHINISYETANKHLFFIDDIMRLYLTNSAPVGGLYYSLSPENTINFNELNNIYQNYIHLISFEAYEVSNTDRFKYIRNPRLMFSKPISIYNEEKYLNSLSDQLAKKFMTTIFLPIYEKDFNLSINYDVALKIYIDEIWPLENEYNQDPDYKRLIFKSIKMYKKVKNFTLLIVNPSFLYFKIEYANREDPSFIIMYLLNSVSFFLDINYVDYPKVIGRLFKGISKMIKTLKYKL